MKCTITYKSHNNLPLEDAITALQAGVEILSDRDQYGAIVEAQLIQGHAVKISLGDFILTIES